MKRVLLIIIDAASLCVLMPAIHSGRLPHLQRLQAATALQAESIAVFPSITPAATTSLITGCYPREHNITGMYWYDPDDHNVVYYGYDMWAILNEGPGKFINDFLIRLNKDFLTQQTLLHRVEQAGLQAASLNFLIFRGVHPHKLHYPMLLHLLPNAPREQEMMGPSLLYFGDFITSDFPDSDETPQSRGGPFAHFGFSDDATADLLIELAQRNHLPDFTVAYFPDNDVHSHAVGPESAVEKLRSTDARLGELFAACGGVDRLLAETCIVLTGDHAQSDVVADKEDAAIQLDLLLDDFAIADLGTPMQSEDDLVVCPNLRTAQIYLHTPTRERVQKLVECLLSDSRIDQVMWQADLVGDTLEGIHVATQDRGHLRFWPAREGVGQGQDAYGGQWAWEGALGCLDAQVVSGVVTFGDYPNAFERVACVQNMRRSGHVWVTAHPGYEFRLDSSGIHAGGGSHGSLHRLDSISPLWVAGAPDGFVLPMDPRSVDVAPICLSILGLKSGRPAGASHM